MSPASGRKAAVEEVEFVGVKASSSQADKRRRRENQTRKLSERRRTKGAEKTFSDRSSGLSLKRLCWMSVLRCVLAPRIQHQEISRIKITSQGADDETKQLESPAQGGVFNGLCKSHRSEFRGLTNKSIHETLNTRGKAATKKTSEILG